MNGREGEITIDVEDRAASPASVSSYEDQQRERGRRLRLPVALTVVSCGHGLHRQLFTSCLLHFIKCRRT